MPRMDRCLQSGHNYGILCHRQYAERIREALLPSASNGWSRLVPSSDFDTLRLEPTTATSDEVLDPTRKCIVIPTPDEKGARKSRIGYILLVFEGAVMSPINLPPMARKQISWAGKVSHHCSVVKHDVIDSIDDKGNTCAESEINGVKDDVCVHLPSNLKTVISAVMIELAQASYDVENDHLRVDVHPKSYNSMVCNAFTDEVKPWPIKLACSASKVSHVVNIIIQSSSAEKFDIYWGISSAKQHFDEMNHRMNDNATSEIIIHSTSHKRPGKELQSDEGEEDSVQWNAPVSRAYYKLAQVFEDDALLGRFSGIKQGTGAGVDIGASPGGWTQVLCNIVRIPTVIAFDPGMLAKRVTMLTGVHHVCAELSSEVSISALSQYAPYSVIVCDACMSNANELLEKIVETFDRVSTTLNKYCDGSRNQEFLGRDLFTWPFCLVITLKLPYKTVGSIDRNLEKVKRYIPQFLNRILSASSSTGDDSDIGVEIRTKLCHLFANSVSERTLIAEFNRK